MSSSELVLILVEAEILSEIHEKWDE